MTLNTAQKTASSSSGKTILGKTLAGSPVNACCVKPESVLLLRVCILENTIVLVRFAGWRTRSIFNRVQEIFASSSSKNFIFRVRVRQK